MILGSIGASAFENCVALAEIIPDSVVSIRNEAFYGCGGLTDGTAPKVIFVLIGE